MRKQPGSPPPTAPKQNDKVITQQREYELITPLFGGGVNPGEADPVTLIRGTEIRGQLRFWWRACSAGKFKGNLATMKKAEDTLWGAAYKKDDPIIAQEQIVQIAVETTRQNRPTAELLRNMPGYAAGPQQDELKKRASDMLREHVSFSLTISFPADRQKEVKAALWAWETFGGIGARTRRGFGAIHLQKINNANYTDLPPSNEVKAWIEKNLNNFVEPGNSPLGIPYLSRNVQFVVTPSVREATYAWKNLIDTLRKFRQAGRPGPSLWPEAKAIRRITSEQGRQAPHTAKFPRAAFGLPIIFHFKGDNPKDTTLKEKEKEEGEKKERFASPLILRPFLCRDNRAVGLALLLEGSHIDAENLILEEQDKTTHDVKATLTKDEAEIITVLDGETDVLRAFMNFLVKGVK